MHTFSFQYFSFEIVYKSWYEKNFSKFSKLLTTFFQIILKPSIIQISWKRFQIKIWKRSVSFFSSTNSVVASIDFLFVIRDQKNDLKNCERVKSVAKSRNSPVQRSPARGNGEFDYRHKYETGSSTGSFNNVFISLNEPIMDWDENRWVSMGLASAINRTMQMCMPRGKKHKIRAFQFLCPSHFQTKLTNEWGMLI